ncbi:MYND domain protein [Mycena venus]|uniref:MYND domain protein n=1 Tax=Mycena venus TaxID=2733690 RepID=A0A8H6XMG2_9AGAR|nr:MYND domain protein [Mycena venus]
MAPKPPSKGQLEALSRLARRLGSGAQAKPSAPPPDKHIDREGWNAYYEREVAAKYACISADYPMMEDSPEQEKCWKACGPIADLKQHNNYKGKLLMHEEGILIAVAIENLHDGNFEAEWKALDADKKKELVIEGIYRAVCTAPRDLTRMTCPELTVKGLSGDGKYSLIKMLERIIAHDPTGNLRVKTMYLFSHAQVDHEMSFTERAPDLLKTFIQSMVLARNWLIVKTLVGILEAYRNEPATIHPKARMGGWKEQKDKANRYGDCHPSQFNEPPKKDVLSACAGCLTVFADRSALKKCAQCQHSWYCSRECQKKDWPSHKKICGNNSFDSTLLSPAAETPDEFIGCPAVAPGFVRSPALWRQISYLSKRDSQTQVYHLQLTTTPKRSTSVSLSGEAQLVFLVARRRAMASGSLPAIIVMLEILLRDARRLEGRGENISQEKVRAQLEREYRVDLSAKTIAMAPLFVQATMQECEEELRFMKQRIASLKGDLPTGCNCRDCRSGT